MTAALVLGAVIAAASLLGWGVLWLTGRLASQFLRIALAVVASLAALAAGYIVMDLTGFVIPAADASIFGDRKSITLELSHHPSRPSIPTLSVEAAIPGAVAVDHDVAIELLVSDPTSLLPQGSYVAVLESSGALEMRTPSPCPAPSPVSNAGGMTSNAACQERGTSQSPLRFRWFVRSTKPGGSYLTLKWPPQFGAALSPEKAWTGHLKRDDREILANGSVEDTRGRGSGGGGYAMIPATVSTNRPVFRGRDFEVDLAAQQFTVPFRVETTLGVSAATYAGLSTVGAALSGLLGGGWVWQLFAWLRDRKGPKRGRPTRR
jgi:hypothetical protein